MYRFSITVVFIRSNVLIVFESTDPDAGKRELSTRVEERRTREFRRGVGRAHGITKIANFHPRYRACQFSGRGEVQRPTACMYTRGVRTAGIGGGTRAAIDRERAAAAAGRRVLAHNRSGGRNAQPADKCEGPAARRSRWGWWRRRRCTFHSRSRVEKKRRPAGRRRSIIWS